jgi:hypothetical protein
MTPLEYPLWLQATHFFNFFLLSLLVRSGLEILSAHPRLYWNDDWFRRPVQVDSPNTVYGPPLTISATANTNPGRSNIDSAFLVQGCL